VFVNLLPEATYKPSVKSRWLFSSFEGYLFYLQYIKTKGGERMDEDYDIFEMFQEIIASLEQKDPNGNMRMLSQNPRYNENPEPDTKNTITHKR
jgi:hypothetical protein